MCDCMQVRVCRAPSASKWTWDCAKKGEVRQLLAKSNCDPAGGNRCHYLPAWLLAPAPRWKKPVLEKTTQVEGRKGVNLFIFPFCKLGLAAFLLKCILVVIVLHTSLKNSFKMHILAVILSLSRMIWKFTIILFPQLGAGLQIYILP